MLVVESYVHIHMLTLIANYIRDFTISVDRAMRTLEKKETEKRNSKKSNKSEILKVLARAVLITTSLFFCHFRFLTRSCWLCYYYEVVEIARSFVYIMNCFITRRKK